MRCLAFIRYQTKPLIYIEYENYGAIYSSDTGGLYLWGDNDDSGIVIHYNAPDESYISGGEYDIVRANWGDLWRMPHRKDMKELISDCEWTLVTVNGVNGTKQLQVTGTVMEVL